MRLVRFAVACVSLSVASLAFGMTQSSAPVAGSHGALLDRISARLDLESLTPPPAREVARAAKAALKELVLDATDLEQFFDPHENRRFPAPTSSSSGSRDDRVRLRLGVSHLAPRVEMQYPLGGGALGLSVSALGQVSLEVRRAGFAKPRLHAGYNASSGTCDVLWRLAF